MCMVLWQLALPKNKYDLCARSIGTAKKARSMYVHAGYFGTAKEYARSMYNVCAWSFGTAKAA